MPIVRTYYGIAVDGISVYFYTNLGDASGAVMRVASSGGAPTTLASNQTTAFAVAVDGTSVYWTNCNSDGTVMKLTPK